MAKQYNYVTDVKNFHTSDRELDAVLNCYSDMFNIPGEWDGHKYYHNKKLTMVQISEIKGFIRGLSYANYDMV
ncbi:MAG: hypothetical protein KAR42_14705 [candidate division Zixibacteria bacterium]|nr:hypothetical protein [candidate division Zixibacteria bacterium]